MNKMKEYVKFAQEGFKNEIARMDKKPKLAIVQVGNNEASNRYIRNKINDCEKVGAIAHHYWYEEDIGALALEVEVRDLAETYDGIIVQLPLPEYLKKVQRRILSAIPPNKDVDGLRQNTEFWPATPLGIMDYLKWRNFDLEGKNVLVIGRSDLVGKPMAQMMIKANATVTVAHSKTPKEKIEELAQEADLVVCAVGQPGFLDGSKLKAAIDVGVNFVDGKLVGDIVGGGDNVSPVPGGVGLLTRCALIKNLILATDSQIS